jgi:hypothetical protein
MLLILSMNLVKTQEKGLMVTLHSPSTIGSYMKDEFLIAPMDLVKNASELTTLRTLHAKEMPTLHEWGPGLLLAGPQYTPSYVDLMTSLHSHDRYGKVEEMRSSNPQDAVGGRNPCGVESSFDAELSGK